jgi:hypothetical protein
MRTFTPPAGTRFYAGVDLHARALFLVVLDQDGHVVFARNLPANPDAFLRAIAPFRDGLLVAWECMHCWYWLADTCREHPRFRTCRRPVDPVAPAGREPPGVKATDVRRSVARRPGFALDTPPHGSTITLKSVWPASRLRQRAAR